MNHAYPVQLILVHGLNLTHGLKLTHLCDFGPMEFERNAESLYCCGMGNALSCDKQSSAPTGRKWNMSPMHVYVSLFTASVMFTAHIMKGEKSFMYVLQYGIFL